MRTRAQRPRRPATIAANKQAYLGGVLGAACQKTKLCAFFLHGECPKGNECTFAHGREELRAMPDLSRTKPCPRMLKVGWCSLGHMCSYAHYEGELRDLSAVAAESATMRLGHNQQGAPEPSCQWVVPPSAPTAIPMVIIPAPAAWSESGMMATMPCPSWPAVQAFSVAPGSWEMPLKTARTNVVGGHAWDFDHVREASCAASEHSWSGESIATTADALTSCTSVNAADVASEASRSGSLTPPPQVTVRHTFVHLPCDDFQLEHEARPRQRARSAPPTCAEIRLGDLAGARS